MQAARVVSGSLVTDIDMAGALGLLARPPPLSPTSHLFNLVPHPTPHPRLSPPLHFPLIYFLLFLCRLSSTLTPSLIPSPGLPFPCRLTASSPPAGAAGSLAYPSPHPLSPRSWKLAPPSKERLLSGPVQDRTEQGGVLQHWLPEHLVDREEGRKHTTRSSSG